MSRRPRWRFLLGGLVVVSLLAGCRVEVGVAVDVDGDGGGEVRVATALDEAAAAQVPDLADALEVADLVAAGWQVSGPTLEEDGRTWVRASKPFDRPGEVALVVAEVAGVDGPFRHFDVSRTPTVLRDEWDFTGTVDLTDGLGSFSDDALRARLDGTDVGRTVAELEQAAGRPLDEALSFRVAVDLPGHVDAGDLGEDGDAAVWHPPLGRQLDLAATARQWNAATMWWWASSAAAATALLVVVISPRRRRRPRGRSVDRPAGAQSAAR